MMALTNDQVNGAGAMIEVDVLAQEFVDSVDYRGIRQRMIEEAVQEYGGPVGDGTDGFHSDEAIREAARIKLEMETIPVVVFALPAVKGERRENIEKLLEAVEALDEDSDERYGQRVSNSFVGFKMDIQGELEGMAEEDD